ncbi:Male-specific lethal 3 -like protein [Collichthys lucidus]|uniref:Male-specific lethal 3-like protein n=1 Tax=Collichthys lucidus TaxID=240159 RepID=A0A4U5TXI3_COLLU|nr:Male-specific lethal 3 -like protein [Collichthys lucidus]
MQRGHLNRHESCLIENVYESKRARTCVVFTLQVLDVLIGTDEHGRRIPKYLIHFNGWNRSWDRWAAEDHVLRDTEDNRKLQHKLARKALGRMKRKGWAKRRRRQSGTKSSLKTLPKEDDSDDACLISSSESSDGDDSDPESSNSGDSAFSEDINKMVMVIRLASMTYSDSISRNEFSFSCQRFVSCLFQRVEPDINVKRECEEKIVHVDINIPDVLKKKLEDDCFYINKRKKLVMVPCQTNVVHILESYVKHFAINKAFMANERYRRQQNTTQSSSPQPVPPEKSEELCKEMVDGLRITFDFTLPMILLYPCEQAQFKKVSSSRVFLAINESSPCSSNAHRERSPSPLGHNPPTPQSTDSQPALSDISATTPTAPAPTPKRRRHPDMDCISYQSQSLRRSTRNTSGGDRPAEGSSGGGGSATASPQLKRRLVDTSSQPKFFLNLERIIPSFVLKSSTLLKNDFTLLKLFILPSFYPLVSHISPVISSTALLTHSFFSSPRNPSAQWLILPVALDAEQRAKWAFLRPGEPEKQRAKRGDDVTQGERFISWKENKFFVEGREERHLNGFPPVLSWKLTPDNYPLNDQLPPPSYLKTPRDPRKDADPREEPSSPGQTFGTLSQVYGRVPRGFFPRVCICVSIRGPLQHETTEARLLKEMAAIVFPSLACLYPDLSGLMHRGLNRSFLWS